MNLLSGNLACAALLGPLLVVDRARFWTPNDIACAVAEGSTAFFCLAAVLGVLLIAADQYLAVIDPLRYHARLGRARSLLMISAQWTISAIFGTIAALAPRPAPSAWGFCRPSEDHSTTSIYKIIFSCIYIGCVLFSLSLICLMYARISLAARRSARPPAPPPALVSLKIDPIARNDSKSGDECVGLLMSCDKKSVGSDSSEGNPTVEGLPPYEPRLARSLRSVLLDVNKPYPSPLCLKFTHESEKKGLSHDDIYKISQEQPAPALKTVRSSPNFGSSECQVETPPPRSYMSTLRCRISNASLFRYREESRAARISALVVFLALVSQLPAAALQAAPALGLMPLVALCLGGCISPFLFAYRSRRIKKELFSLCSRSASDIYPHAVPLRRTSSLSTERSWRSSRLNSSQAALRLLKALAAERDTQKKPAIFVDCPPGKSILKRVRAQSLRWGRRPRRCKFSTDFSPGCSVIAAPEVTNLSSGSSNGSHDSTNS